MTRFTAYDDVNWKPLAAKDGDGRIETWHFGKGRDFWFLRATDGYVRTLEKTWAASVPLIQMVLENHGLMAEVS